MGRASSSKKVARASKAAGRPGTSKSLVWPLTIGVVVLVGIALIALSAAGRDSGARAAPILGDHWHAAYGVYACDTFLPPVTDAVADESGVHAHGDGLIHIHPFNTRYTGDDANLRAFGETTALVVEDDSITMPDGQSWTNGDDCGGEPGVVQVKVWDELNAEEGRLLESDFGDYAPQDGELVTIAFAPEGADIPKPPSAGTQPTDVVPAPGDTVPEGVPSTLPAEQGPTDGEGEGGTPEPDDSADTTDTSAP